MTRSSSSSPQRSIHPSDRKESNTLANLAVRTPLVIFGLLMVVNCGTVDPTGGLPPGDAQLAILNGLESGVVGSIMLDDNPITLPQQGGRISRVIPAGSHRIEALSQAGLLISGVTFNVAEGGRRTAIVGGAAMDGTASLLVGADTTSIPNGNVAKLRLVHTVTGVVTLEARLVPSAPVPGTEARLISPLGYGLSDGGVLPGYQELLAGTYSITVSSVATGAAAAQLDLQVKAGEIWSAILSRRHDGELALVPVKER